MIDKEARDEQELKDFLTTKQIMKEIMAQYGANVTMTQMPVGYKVDARMTVQKSGKGKKYTVEIKERNRDYNYDATLPLLVDKFCKIQEVTEQIETPLIIYLCDNNDYFIYDLNNLDLNKILPKLWYIKDVQFSTDNKKSPKPTYFLPTEDAVYSGKYKWILN